MKRVKPTVAEIRRKKRFPITVMLENIRSRYNVGAMFRTADAALVERVFLGGSTATPPHKEMDKVALGATDVVPWEQCPDVKGKLLELKKAGIHLVALEQTQTSISYTDATYDFPLCLVVGNEVDGVSQEVLDVCDTVIAIPMFGRATSLNVATAFGIAVFEILHNYRKNASL